MKTAALAAHLSPSLAALTAPGAGNNSQTSYTAVSALSQEAAISLTTREGDRITINQSALSRQLASATLASATGNGRTSGQGQASLASFASQGMTITVEGDLNDQELADLGNLLGDLSAIAADFFAGDLDSAMSGALRIGDMGSIGKLEASFSQSTLLSQHLTGNHPLPALEAAGQDPLFEALFADRAQGHDQTSEALARQWHQFLTRFSDQEVKPAPPADPKGRSASQAGEAMLARGRQTLTAHPRLTPLLPSLADLAIAVARRQQEAQGPANDQSAVRLSKAFTQAFSGWLL